MARLHTGPGHCPILSPGGGEDKGEGASRDAQFGLAKAFPLIRPAAIFSREKVPGFGIRRGLAKRKVGNGCPAVLR